MLIAWPFDFSKFNLVDLGNSRYLIDGEHFFVVRLVRFLDVVFVVNNQFKFQCAFAIATDRVVQFNAQFEIAARLDNRYVSNRRLNTTLGGIIAALWTDSD